VRQAAAEGQKRLARVSVGFILADRIFHGLASQRVLQLSGEHGQAVQEDHLVQAILILPAVSKLARYAEEVACVQALCFLIQTAGGVEVGELELAARILEPAAQHVRAPRFSISRARRLTNCSFAASP